MMFRSHPFLSPLLCLKSLFKISSLSSSSHLCRHHLFTGSRFTCLNHMRDMIHRDSIASLSISAVNNANEDVHSFPSPRVLSIQSHTVHGYVGNKASTFPLQCLGFDVDAINSITLSNRPGSGYIVSKGQIMENQMYKDIIDGLESNQLLDYDVILTGYANDTNILQQSYHTIQAIQKINPHVIYVCDPVLGDNSQYYVPSHLKTLYQTLLLPLATVVTPNQFEAEELSGIKIQTLQDVYKVCDYLHALGIKVCILKGIHFKNSGKFSMFISHKSKSSLSSSSSVVLNTFNSTDTGSSTTTTTQTSAAATTTTDSFTTSSNSTLTVFKIDLDRITDRSFSGCGDLLSAITAGYIHHFKQARYRHKQLLLSQAQQQSNTHGGAAADTNSMTSNLIPYPSFTQGNVYLADVLEDITGIIHNVLHLTEQHQSKELCIIQAADLFIAARNRLHSLYPRVTVSSVLSSSNSDVTIPAVANKTTSPVLSTSLFTTSSSSSSSQSSSSSPFLQSVPLTAATIPPPLPSKRSNKIQGSGLIGVIFDMDGTLTKEGSIDFTSMYTRTHLKQDRVSGDILTQIRALPTLQLRQEAYQIIFEEEMKGCERQVLREGLYTLFQSLYQERIRIAIATRNCHEAAMRFLEKAEIPTHLFTHILHRKSLPLDTPSGSGTTSTATTATLTATSNGEDDAVVYINKPDRRVADTILSSWEIHDKESAAKTLFVGDSIDDMICGRNAGCKTCFVLTTDNEGLCDLPQYKHWIDYKVRTLDEIIALIHSL